eukprot:4946684-Amphidinium_carterae.1
MACLQTEGLHGSTVPAVPSRVNVSLGESGGPTLLLCCPKSRPFLGWVIRHRRGRLDLLSEGLRHPVSCQGETDGVVVRLVLQARLCSGRVAHVGGDKEPVELSAHLPLGVRRGGSVVGRRPNNRVTPSQRNRKLIRQSPPMT